MSRTAERTDPAELAGATGRSGEADHGAASELTGTGTLVRLAVRRDRMRLSVWVVAVAGLVLFQAASLEGLYPTRASLEEAARVVGDNPAIIAAQGPPVALGTLGGRVTFEVGLFAAVLAALMSVLAVVRHTRAEEEAGRAELLRSAVLGRHAQLAAALIVVVAADVALGAGVTVAALAVGLPAGGSAALGVVVGGAGIVFAGIAAVAAQVVQGARTASGLGIAVLGAAFVLRAAGDVGDGTLSWLSPLGWAQALRPFGGERWWAVGILVVAFVVLTAIAAALVSRRDLDAGLVQPRPGRPEASAGLTSGLGLAVRLHRGTVAAWTVGLFLFGVAYGSVGKDVDDLIGDDEAMRDILANAGGNLTDSFFATAAVMLAVLGAGFAVQAALRARGEETDGRAEPLLATALTRTAWAGSHLLVAAVGSVLVLAAAGAGTGLSYGIAIHDLGQVPRLAGATLAQVPAVWVLIGVEALLFGLVPRATAVVWAVLGWCAVVAFFGTVLDLPSWLLDLSPFRHVPQVPAAPFELLPLVVLSAVAAALTAAGALALAHRDIG